MKLIYVVLALCQLVLAGYLIQYPLDSSFLKSILVGLSFSSGVFHLIEAHFQV